MPFDTPQREHAAAATSQDWLAPLSMLVAWLVSLLNHIARLKRIRATTRFKPRWTDSWDDLRRLEWRRDQMLAQGAALLLAGKTLDDADAILTDPPDGYGGPRPAAPFQMQRRFLAIAEWLKDPEGRIRRHAARIARRMDLARTRDPLGPARRRAASLACNATAAGGMRASCAHDKGGLAANRARAPPAIALFATRSSLLTQRAQRA